MSSLIARIERELSQPDPAEQVPRPQWPRHAVTAFLLLMTPLFLMEILLRIVWTPAPQVPRQARAATAKAAAESLNARFSTEAFEPDPHLIWRLRSGANLDGLTVSTRGLLGADEAALGTSRRRGEVRVLVLGDSIPALSYRTFPLLVERLAKEVPGVPELVMINAAVPGYSTEQGLKWLEQLRDLRPDLVIASFGLADRSPALNLPDRYLLSGSGTGAGIVRTLFGGLRVVQWLMTPKPDRWSRTGNLEEEARVEPNRFQENLKALAVQASDMGAELVITTVPVRGAETSEAEKYNDRARRAADQAGVPLLDLEEEFTRRDRERLLEEDGFHLTSAGHNLVARLLTGMLRDRGILDAQDVEAIAESARYDSASPDRVAAEWTLYPSHVNTSTSESVLVSVLVRNAGNTRWLRNHFVETYGEKRDFDYGGVGVQAVWRTAGASPTMAPAARVRLPQDVPPGESTSVTLSLTAPPEPGTYAAAIGLATDGIGALDQLGAEVTTLTVTVREPNS